MKRLEAKLLCLLLAMVLQILYQNDKKPSISESGDSRTQGNKTVFYHFWQTNESANLEINLYFWYSIIIAKKVGILKSNGKEQIFIVAINRYIYIRKAMFLVPFHLHSK